MISFYTRNFQKSENNQMKFTESKLEQAFTAILANEGYPHFVGNSIVRTSAVGLAESEVLIEE